MGVLSDSFGLKTGIAPWVVKKTCCRSAFLRGCLMGAGSANTPQKEAHLEILTPHQDLCDDLVRLLASMDFHPGHTVRRGSHVVYVKGRDEVAGVLALAGAHCGRSGGRGTGCVQRGAGPGQPGGQLRLCQRAAHGRRRFAAAGGDCEPWSGQGVCAALPPALREMAELRLDNPYLNLVGAGRGRGRGTYAVGGEPSPAAPGGGGRARRAQKRP